MLEELVVRPSVAVATTESWCVPAPSVVVSNTPDGSPLKRYGAMCSVHLVAPSILKSTLLTVAPSAVAVQGTEPAKAAPFPMLEVTVNAGATPRFATLTEIFFFAVRPSTVYAAP